MFFYICKLRTIHYIANSLQWQRVKGGKALAFCIINPNSITWHHGWSEYYIVLLLSTEPGIAPPQTL